MVYLPENREYSERNILNESIFALSTLFPISTVVMLIVLYAQPQDRKPQRSGSV